MSDDDKTVKELLDAATRAELERWFGLPSFTQAEEARAAKPPEADPDIMAARERRQKAIEAVDPAMLEAHRRRVEPPDDLIRFKATIDVVVDPGMALLDHAMIERGTIAEPREVEIPEELREDLRECAPQALLRDLHRPELDFDKSFEIIDHAAEGRVDAVTIVDELMRTRYRIEPTATNTFAEGSALLRELRTNRLAPWSEDHLAKLPNRRVSG